MPWLVIVPFVMGAAGLVTTIVLLAFGYRALPERIPKYLNAGAVLTIPWSGRRKLQSLAAENSNELTMARAWLLVFVVCIGANTLLQAAFEVMDPRRRASESAAVMPVGAAFVNLFLATWVYLLVRAAHRSTDARAALITARLARRFQMLGFGGLLFAVAYCTLVFVLIRIGR